MKWINPNADERCRLMAQATEIDVRSHVGDPSKRRLEFLTLSFVGDNP